MLVKFPNIQLIINRIKVSEHVFLMNKHVHLKIEWQAPTLAFISHKRKQVVNQYLYLHFPTQSM